jgi:hypothetical protein
MCFVNPRLQNFWDWDWMIWMHQNQLLEVWTLTWYSECLTSLRFRRSSFGGCSLIQVRSHISPRITTYPHPIRLTTHSQEKSMVVWLLSYWPILVKPRYYIYIWFPSFSENPNDFLPCAVFRHGGWRPFPSDPSVREPRARGEGLASQDPADKGPQGTGGTAGVRAAGLHQSPTGTGGCSKGHTPGGKGLGSLGSKWDMCVVKQM